MNSKTIKLASLYALRLVISIGLILYYVLFSGLCYAADVCGDRVYLNITISGDCGPTPTCTTPDGCSSSILDTESVDCVSYVCEVCCPDTFNEQRDDSTGNTIVTDVPIGDEQQSAQTWFNSWSSVNEYQPAPEGYNMTGTMEGFAYNTTQADLPGTVDVNVRGWKRGFYTKQGTAEVTPVENLGSGDAAGVIKTGVGDAIDEKFGNQGSYSGYIGSGDQSADNTNISQNSKDYPTGIDSWSGIGTVTYDSIPTRITNFIASNPIVSLFTGSHFTAVDDECDFSCEWFGHTLTFSFCEWSDFFNLMGTLVLAMATLYSILIALGRA